MKCIMCNAIFKAPRRKGTLKICPKCGAIVGTINKPSPQPVPPKGGTGTVPPKATFPAFLAESQRADSKKPSYSHVEDEIAYLIHDQPKDTRGKYIPHLVCASLTRAIARVREYGVRKYKGEDGWKQQTALDYLDAIGRHYDECRNNPISRDTESGLLHVAQIATNAMFVLQMLSEQGVDLDVMNEPPKEKKDGN